MAITPFTKLLIANRGEIALRIIRAARGLGYPTVAVYSSADANARHVREADQAVCIGAAAPSQSYLAIESILTAARRSGADAVHPGYGFLAENALFAQACVEAGMVFVGPSAAAIRAMGDKAGAKRVISQASVPCLPGYDGEDQSEVRLATEAARIGYPVMIKATAGGGGRGMRLVSTPEEFASALQSARSEAQGAFGRPDVLLERAIVRPRHIEIQILADRYGNIVHLGERDCSVQRRHQKLIEEAPSPALTPALRTRMGTAAVQAARAIGYEGLGTLEFLLEEAGDFYFIEMNTRLQVEHPVTEAVTGLDLVDLQLRIAAGEPLLFGQDEVQFAGHAIEARLCAEDPNAGFLPQSGGIAWCELSSSVRIEHALERGTEISSHYDSMIAKFISVGRDRDEARRKLAGALDDSILLGIETNRAFLSACLRHPDFVQGRVTTAFIGDHVVTLLAHDEANVYRALAVVALLRQASATAKETTALEPRGTLHVRLELHGAVEDVALTRRGSGQWLAAVGGRDFDLELLSFEAPHARVCCDGVAEPAVLVREGPRLFLQYRGTAYTVWDRTFVPTQNAAPTADGRLRASMNGRVVALHARVGDTVIAGQAIFTIEAMKIEHTHVAPCDGQMLTLHAELNEQIAAQLVVAEIAPRGSPAAESRGGAS